MGRSILAVVAGYLLFTTLSRSASYVLTAVFPGAGTAGFAASLTLGLVAAVAGGNACARLAPSGPRVHVAILAGILAAIGLGLLLAPPAGIPRSVALAEIAAGVLGVLAGGALHAGAR